MSAESLSAEEIAAGPTPTPMEARLLATIRARDEQIRLLHADHEQHHAALAAELDHARQQIAGMRQELSRHEATLAQYRRSATGELEPDEAEPVKIAAVIERLKQERDSAREGARLWRALADILNNDCSCHGLARGLICQRCERADGAWAALRALGIDPDAPEPT